jgi:hypothetical protein
MTNRIPPLPGLCLDRQLKTGARLPNHTPIGILPPKMNNQYAHSHHLTIQPPPGREVNRRAPVIE